MVNGATDSLMRTRRPRSRDRSGQFERIAAPAWTLPDGAGGMRRDRPDLEFGRDTVHSRPQPRAPPEHCNAGAIHPGRLCQRHIRAWWDCPLRPPRRFTPLLAKIRCPALPCLCLLRRIGVKHEA